MTDGGDYYQVTTAFERHLRAPVRERLATVGRFLDSETGNPAGNNNGDSNAGGAAAAPLQAPARRPPPALCLAVASSGHKVLLHNNNTYTAAAKRSAKRGVGSVGGGGGGAADSDEGAVHSLGFGKEPTALAAGRMSLPNDGGGGGASPHALDTLLMGASASLLLYNVNDNRQILYKEVEDGVAALACGPMCTSDAAFLPTAAGAGGGDDGSHGAAPPPRPTLAITGGNCTIYGFDAEGAERYWTITGDQVCAMAMLPWPRGGGGGGGSGGADRRTPALLVASEDAEIRVFDCEEAVCSITEVDAARQLVAQARPHDPLATAARPSDLDWEGGAGRPACSAAGRFAYLLDNGTVGVYAGAERQWRVKGRGRPVSAAFCDVDCDGVEELVVGWSDGRVEVRGDTGGGGNASGRSRGKGGEVLYRSSTSHGEGEGEAVPAPVAAVLAEDYRQDGRVLPLVVATDGLVRGLTLLESRLESAEETREARAVEELAQQRQVLAAQLASLEEQLALKKKGEADATMPEAGLEVSCEYCVSAASGCLEITFTARNGQSDTVVHSAVLQPDEGAGGGGDTNNKDNTNSGGGAAGDGAAGVFGNDGGCRAFYADDPSASLTCALRCPADAPLAIRAAVVVGSLFAANYHVFDVSLRVPRYAMYLLPEVAAAQVQSLQQRRPSLLAAPPTAAPPPPLVGGFARPAGYVTLTYGAPLLLRPMEQWVRANFCLPAGYPLVSGGDGEAGAEVLLLEVISVRGGIDGGGGGKGRGGEAEEEEEEQGGGGGYAGCLSLEVRARERTVTIRADTMAAAGALLNALADGLGTGGALAGSGGPHPASVRCDFPAELQRLGELLERVEAFSAARGRLSSDMADAAAAVKTLLLRAEDARLLGGVADMRRAYAALYDVDRELLGENKKRVNNFEQLKAALRRVNLCIQRAARLRLGPARSALVAACRGALKENRLDALVSVIQQGA